MRRTLTRRQPRGLEVLIGGCAFRPAKEEEEEGEEEEEEGEKEQQRKRGIVWPHKSKKAALADRKKVVYLL